MKDILMKMLSGMIASILTSQTIRELKDKGIELYQIKSDKQLDKLEDYIKKTATKVDDAFLPLIATFRKVFMLTV